MAAFKLQGSATGSDDCSAFEATRADELDSAGDAKAETDESEPIEPSGSELFISRFEISALEAIDDESAPVEENKDDPKYR
jgi:hypothetical protein